MPTAAPVGGHVHIDGYGFTDASWRQAGASLWLSGVVTGCDFFATAEHTVTVNTAGHLTGDFTVPAGGDCRMTTPPRVAPVNAGHYKIVFQCTVCTIGNLDVSTGGATPERHEALIDSGTASGEAWQLKATQVGTGPVCATLSQAGRQTGQACDAPSEQDANGDSVLRYGAANIAPSAPFVVGVTRADVVNVRAELVNGATAERATVANTLFAANRFVAISLPPATAIRALVAFDHSGQVLTRIVINP